MQMIKSQGHAKKQLDVEVSSSSASFLTPLVHVVFFLFKQVFSNSIMSVCHFTLTVVTEQQHLLQ